MTYCRFKYRTTFEGQAIQVKLSFRVSLGVGFRRRNVLLRAFTGSRIEQPTFQLISLCVSSRKVAKKTVIGAAAFR